MKSSQLIAWEIHHPPRMILEPAPPDRTWMDQTDGRHAYRCLPLVIANQAGWILRSPTAFSVRWNGGPRRQDLRLGFPRGRKDQRICSHFGAGILTIGMPYLFRTPPGVNLWVKGPANLIKDGIQPLEGVVETDWSEFTFTMNWKCTRPNCRIRFDEGEPICMIVPVPRGLAESLEPACLPLASNRKLHKSYHAWEESRIGFNQALAREDDAVVAQGWQRDYMLGRDGAGRPFPGHQTKLHLRSFRGAERSAIRGQGSEVRGQTKVTS
ncbi:MAG: DUF6065 family protein [Gemmataceae bacterium]|nr:DUF6065 family protein [Gemmataceae bacterium]